ncbi:MAG: DUF58 domain-containing protein [Dechloromonas sp.]|nr:DUF58 domain-containing protein [Dechloromonas sp.]
MTWRDTLQKKLFRWHDDGDGTISLGRRRIFILPSAAGLLYALTLLVMLLAAINYRLALGHALTFFLAALGVVGMIHTFRNLYGLRLKPLSAAPVFVGEMAEFTLRVSNPTPEARPDLNFALAEQPIRTIAVDGLSEQKIQLTLPARQRGWLTLPRVRLRSRYPLGLFTAWSDLHPRLRCLVYPQPLPQPLPAHASGADSSGGNQPQGQAEFAGFRPRQASDPLRHVAWKASARGGPTAPLLIAQYHDGEENCWQFDWQDCPPEADHEQRLSILTGWVLVAAAQGWTYRLQLPGQRIPDGQGEAQRLRCLQALALYPA